jgi:hypothetical protein
MGFDVPHKVKALLDGSGRSKRQKDKGKRTKAKGKRTKAKGQRRERKNEQTWRAKRVGSSFAISPLSFCLLPLSFVICHLSFVPGPGSSFARGAVDGFGGGVTQGQEHVSGSLGLVVGEMLEGLAECGQAEVGLAGGPVDAIKECGQVDEFGAILHEIKVQDLLLRHNVGVPV